MADTGRSEGGSVKIITHGVILGVVPHGGDNATVVIAHNLIGNSTTGSLSKLNEFVSRTLVIGLLFRLIRVILVANILDCQKKGLGGVLVVGQQILCQTVDLGRVILRMKNHFPVYRLGVGISPKIMVKGIVFLEDDHHVLDGRGSIAGFGAGRRSESDEN